MEEPSREVVARVRAAICAEIDKQNGANIWSLPFSLDQIAKVAARAAQEPPK